MEVSRVVLWRRESVGHALKVASDSYARGYKQLNPSLSLYSSALFAVNGDVDRHIFKAWSIFVFAILDSHAWTLNKIQSWRSLQSVYLWVASRSHGLCRPPILTRI